MIERKRVYVTQLSIKKTLSKLYLDIIYLMVG